MNGGTNIVIADQIVTKQIYHQVLMLKSFEEFSDHRGNCQDICGAPYQITYTLLY